MRILFIHNSYQYKGGEDTAVELEIAVLREKGHEVALLHFENRPVGSIKARIKAGLSAFYNKHSAQKVTSAIKAFRPDIIHVHNLFFQASPSVLYAAKSAGVPVILTIHNYRMVCSNALLLRNNQVCELCIQHNFPLRGIVHKCYRNSALESALVTGITGIYKLLDGWQKNLSGVIFLTEFMREKLTGASFTIPAEKCFVKPNFVPDCDESPLSREGFFLFAGRLSPEKGISILLEAFEKMPDISLVIAGDGPEIEITKASTSRCANIQYVGRKKKDELMALMRKCRALVFPSIWYEGMPLTILEALASGTPVLASRLGAIKDIIVHGRNGLLFQQGDSASLSSAVREFIAMEHSLPWNTEARNSYLQYYSPEQHYSRIMEIYSSVINKHQPHT